MSIDLTVDATVPSNTTLEAIVYEDLDGDSTVDNQQTQAVADGENTYTLDQLQGGGSNYWIQWKLSVSDVEVTPIVHSGSVTV